MSADTSRDVTLIQDEDLLRKMWQDTQDFGRKKEIRTHMYKLREARLRDFYNTTEVNSEIKRSTTESKSCDKPTHADSLADHSFLSLKSKEIRDSESPTRDMNYKITEKHNDNGWNVVSSNERSDDGKTFTTKRSATTSGSQKFDGGKVDYAARNDQKAFVHKDGDDKNFTKAVGAESHSVIKQEAVGGDENSNFKSSSTKTSSSSRVVTEHRSGDVIENVPAITSSSTVTKQIYGNNIPEDVRNHPNYVDGKTKVFRETKTLADGSTVTTTRYETVGGSTSQHSTKQQQHVSTSSTNQRKSDQQSTNVKQSNVTVTKQDTTPSNRNEPVTYVDDNTRVYKETKTLPDGSTVTTTKYETTGGTATSKTEKYSTSSNQQHTNTSSTNQRVTDQQSTNVRQLSNKTDSKPIRNEPETYVDGNTKVFKETKTLPDGSTVTTTRYETTGSTSKNERYSTSNNQQKSVVQESHITNKNVTDTRNNQTNKAIEYVVDDYKRTPEITVQITRDNVDRRKDSTTNVQSSERINKINVTTDVCDNVRDIRPVTNKETYTTTKTTTIYNEPEPVVNTDVKYSTTSVVNKKQVTDHFINKEQQHEKETRPRPSSPDRPLPTQKQQEPYEQPERRQPIKPGKSEMDRKPEPTDGQYDTTYKSEFTPKRISVDVSPTHDAFARSLRAVSPDRISHRGSVKSLRTSTSSLRSSTSPEKNRHPGRYSPERRPHDRSTSPRKSTDRFSSTETITYKNNRTSPEKRGPKSPERTVTDKTRTDTNYNTDTITRRSKITNGYTTREIDSNTLTRRKNTPRSRSPSPSTTASDIEYIRTTNEEITDLDDETVTRNVTTKNIKNKYDITRKDVRPTSLEITTKKTRKITDRSPTSPLTDLGSPKRSPSKEIPRRSSLKSPVKEPLSPSESFKRNLPKDKPLKRTDTYEERCRQILGITSETTTERRRSSLEKLGLRRDSITKTKTSVTETPKRTSKSPEKVPRSSTKESPERKEPLRKSPTKDSPTITKKSPTRDVDHYSPARKPSKGSPISEFPSQIRKSPEKEPLEPYPEKRRPGKTSPSVSEFPSQIRRSHEKQPLEPYPEKQKPGKTATSIDEFASQTRRSPQREPLAPYPEKQSPSRTYPSVSEFPSQIRKSPQREPLEPYPERERPGKTSPSVSEFPSQIRKSPQREPLEPYPERERPGKTNPSVSEFPSQIRKSPQREPLEPYPEKERPGKTSPSVSEFPSQIRKSPQREPLEPYPERQRPGKTVPSVSEFPSQIRKSPEREPLEPYPERQRPGKTTPSVSEFPSQIRKSPEREPLAPYPEKQRPGKTGPSVSEFPSQIRRSLEREPLEPYPERQRPGKTEPSVLEFPSQIRKSPEREPQEPYPERQRPSKTRPTVCEFPSQTRRSPEKEPLEPYPEKKKPTKDSPNINEFPSQIRRSPEREPLGEYPEKQRPTKQRPSIDEFPSQVRKSPERVPLEPYPEKRRPTKEGPKVSEFPSQRSPERDYPQKKPIKSSLKKIPKDDESTSEEEVEVEELSTTKKYRTVEATPVDEPLATERFISQLCKDEEFTRTKTTKKDITRQNVENLLEEEIIANETTTKNKTVKKDQPGRPRIPVNDNFIQNERVTIETTTKKTPTKPSERNKAPVNTTVKKDSPVAPKTVRKPFKPGTTEYTDEYGRPASTGPRRIPQKTTEKITLWNVENLSDEEEDTSVHIRTHRIDDTINKKTTRVNGDINKKPAVKKPSYGIPKDDKKPTTRKPDSTKPEKTTNTETKRYTTTKKTTITNTTDSRIKPTYTQSPRKVVSTTITVSPVVKKIQPSKTVTTKTVLTSRISKLAQPKTKPVTTKPTKLQNGHISTEEESDVESVDSLAVDEITTKKSTQKNNKVLRTTSDQIIRTQQKPKSPVRGFSKPELLPKDTKPGRKTEKKCITTKSIIINNKDSNEREVFIDLLRSKSSREPTPDRLCPLPVSSDDDGDTPRYPDEVTEPDDGSLRRKPKKLSDIPIFESEDNYQYTRITDITDNKKITEVDRVEETDDSLLTVDKKISKFLNTADELTKKPLKPKKPAPRVERPELIVNEDMRSDECLLSVSDKVSKFITTAEQLITPQQTVDRPKSPICRNYPKHDDLSNVKVSKKVSQFTTTAEEIVRPNKPSSGPAPKVERPRYTVDDHLKEDECLLSVSDKVTKFITTADTLTKPIPQTKKTPEDRTPARSSPTRVSPTRSSPTRPPTECVTIETEEQTYTRRPSKSPEHYSPTRRNSSPVDEKTPTRRPSNQYSSINKTESYESHSTRRTSSPRSPEITPKTTRRPSEDEPKSPATRLRSTESVKKAKAMFENITREQEILKQKDILSRPSVFEGRKLKTPRDDTKTPKEPKTLKKRLSFSDDEEITTRKTMTTGRNETLKSTKLVIDKMFTKSKSPEKVPEIVTTKTYEYSDRESSIDGDLPGYMRPLDRSLRPHSPHRDNLTQTKKPSHTHEPAEDTRTTKFGVTLKRTDSGRTGTTTTTTTTSATERRKSSITLEKRVTEEEVEEIFELEILEELLEKVVGYDLRRKIRAQIRLVKKLIQDNKLSSYVSSRIRSSPKREPSPTKLKPNDTTDRRKVTEYQTEYTRKSSPERKVIDNKLYQHTDLLNKRDDSTKRTEYQTSYTYNERRSSSEYTSSTRRSPSPSKVGSREKSPVKTVPTRSSTKSAPNRTSPERKTFTQLKKPAPVSKNLTDDKPEWVKQRNLRKVTETSTPLRKVTTTTTTTTSTRRGSARTPSPVKETKPTDIITSSYGVGPTDENGTPLFGLRALRAQNKTDKTKVQGTVIRSEYYSKNGEEPVGEVSVTKYSTDPRDLGSNEDIRSSNKGITSVTTTQKFGYKDTPSLRSLTDKKKAITNTDDETVTTTTKTTSKVTRRGSVKALSQKFIDNATETLKSERQSSYPKAGLILRTSSFKDTSDTEGSREASPVEEKTMTTVRTTKSSRTVEGDSFLRNRSKVTSGQDVIKRMKAEDYEEGDTEEDIQAKGLLNKFIGSQVILSGLEQCATSKTSTTRCSTPSSTSVRRTTKVTSTITEGGKPRTVTRVFQRPVTEQELETVWDEQTLRLLLEQSTDYEERRVIRARLRQVMAEQEACTELVEKASQEQSGGAIEGESLLLPLLQGLLQAPETEQTADSGTESGEDQRSGLIAEVQGALEKLAASLRSDATDVTPERRSSLLQLVTKLQAGLSTTTPAPERRTSSGRFTRRRQRQNRHTVGVSSEELADARRLIEEISLPSLKPTQSVMRLQKQKSESMLSKQSSDSGVSHSHSNSSFKSYLKSPVKNATAKPFSSSNSVSGNSSAVQTPTTETSESLDLLFNEDLKDASERRSTYRKLSSMDETKSKRFSQSIDLPQNVDLKSVQDAVQQAATIKILTERKSISESTQDSEDDETSTIKAPQNPSITQQQLTQLQLQSNPLYDIANNKLSNEEKSNRFNNKKLKMKRANTIDIPKPLLFYDDDEDSDSGAEDENQQRRNNYYALRGPIRVSDTKVKSKVPTFEPKTESDKKFLAFINKQNDTNSQKTSLWAQKTPVWGNKFGNIKNNFENKDQNSAMQFWKSTDDSLTTNYNGQQFGPKISRRSAKNLQQMFEEKQKQTQQQKQATWSPSNDPQNIITGSLKFNAKSLEPEKNYKFVPQPLPVNKFSHAPQSAFKPIPKKDAPKPDSLALPTTDIIKTELREQNGHADAPVYLYSPKPLTTPQTDSSGSSPIVPKPWATSGEHRVLNLAASKFENKPTQEQPSPVKPRKLSKDYNKVFTPQPTQQAPSEKLTAPYLVKSADPKGGSVRKLSGQYDSLNTTKPPDYSTHTTVKYIHPQPETFSQYIPPQTTQFNTPQTYQAVSYTQQSPQNYVTNTQPYPQNYSNQYPQPQNYQPPQSYQPPQQYPQAYQQPQFQPPEHAPVQYYQHIPGQNTQQGPQQYTSSVQYKPQAIQAKTPVIKSVQPSITPKKEQPQENSHKPKYETQTSNESVHEYTPVSSKLMTGPVQQAVTVTQKSPMTRDGHDMAAALGLKNTLQKVNVESKSPSNSFKYKANVSPNNSFNYKPTSPRSNSFKYSAPPQNNGYKSPSNSFKYKTTSPNVENKVKPIETKPLHSMENKNCGIVKPMQHKPPNTTSEINDKGESIVTGKFAIPMISVPKTENKTPTHAQVLSKSESWNQICMQAQSPSPRASPKNTSVVRSKSSHSLAVPKMYEAGMSKDEMLNKRKTMEAFLTGNKSPSHENVAKSEAKVVKRSINRIKTSEKTSTYRHSSETTKKTFSTGPVTTTEVTTRVTTQQMSKKPVSPFAKFRQLDKQNSLPNSPSTPKTPSGSGPLFKFTDPALSQSANTIKDRLLHWCKQKTKEYENIQLDNFSTSWADGLAFCAVVHHFRPDAFDYNALSPKNRRHNFTLAFQVAYEKADIFPLLDVDDMVACRKPDWKCVFTYVQSIYRRFKDED